MEVTFDGQPAPLLWVQDSQVNVVAPWSLTAGQSTEVCVTYNAGETNCLGWPVAGTVPGVFTVDGVHAAPLNEDGSVNSADNPAQPGSIVSCSQRGWAQSSRPSRRYAGRFSPAVQCVTCNRRYVCG